MIELDDQCLSYCNDNFEEKIVNHVNYSDKDNHHAWIEYDIWTFDDDTQIKTIYENKFYNIETESFKLLKNWYIGDHALKIDGTTPKLINHEKIRESVACYEISTELKTNYFVNGLLVKDELSKKEL